MDIELGGLHHLTAITSNASLNVAFYTQVLGLRLVKKTVNQDDVSAYHLFYGDEAGNAGTEVTFFDWEHAGRNLPAAGSISATALRAPGRETVEWWARRFDDLGVTHGEIVERNGRAVLPLADPEGQSLELVDDTRADGDGVGPGTPWEQSPVPLDKGIRGLAAVTLTVRTLHPTEAMLLEVLGFRKTGETDEGGVMVAYYEVGPGGPGAELRVVVRPELRQGRGAGAGGVHHVAFRTPDDEQHSAWQAHLSRLGVGVTPVIDRFYFRSIYFNEPGGVLFEIATDGPGFAADEDPAHLGERLALPPFLEPNRAEIEANLKPITPVDLSTVR